MRNRLLLLGACVVLATLTTRPGASAESDDLSPDFARDVQPILASRCVRCHGRGQAKGGFRVDDRATLVAGGDSGPAVVPGKSGESLLVELVSGKDPDRVMPAQGTRLSDTEVKTVARWIDAGAPWPAGVSFARPAVDENLALAPVKPPPSAAGADFANPIDRFVAGYLDGRQLEFARPVDDHTFIRRVHLDVTGLLPSAGAVQAFLDDQAPDKRARLVDSLLADRRRYAEHWMTFWNDALRNDYQGTGYIDGGRKQITAWLYDSLRDNKPYDQFVRELVNPAPESEGFAKGIVWRGVVNASQVPAVQAAQNIGQVFLGANLKCASCHDSFVNAWKLTDAYGLAAVYADDKLEIHHCDKPTGKYATAAFLFPSLGALDASQSKPDRLRQLAELLTSKQNGRLPRTIINRLWDRFFGRGLIEPVDEMENDPWQPQLLEWLAADLVEHGYDLKHTIKQILTSRAYQMPSVGGGPHDEDYFFRGPLVRRLSAEQFCDAVSQVTGVWQTNPAFMAPFTELDEDAQAGALRFKSGVVDRGAAEIDVDVAGATTLWLVVTPGKAGGHHDWADWGEPRVLVGDREQRLTELGWKTATSGYNTPRVDKNVVGGPLALDGREIAFGIGTHAQSVISYELPPGATRFRAVVGPDKAAVTASPTGHEIEFLVFTDLEVRAVMVPADPLMTALGRPNREQVVTRRPSVATTLEALELNNGHGLDERLQTGAGRWLAQRSWQPGELADALFLAALGRRPTDEESTLAVELLGAPATADGAADLLWSLVMLPEFQLIH